MVVRYYSSVAPETTLTSGINNAATTIMVGSTVGFPALTPYTLALDYEGLTEELVQVNNVAGTSLDVTRAIDGTSAASHNAGARVRHVSSARDFADSRTHENSDEEVHGLGPGEEIVGTDKVQTLNNKTLVSPTINGTVAGSPTFSGTWTGAASAAAKVRLNNNTDVSLTSTDHAFQIGQDANANLRMDVNEIMSANNGAINTLQINALGGVVAIANELTADNTATQFLVNGAADVNQVVVSRVNAATALALNFKADADTTFRFSTRPNGDMSWGPGGVAAQDIVLGRSGTNALTLTGDLFVSNNLGVSNIATINTANVTNLVPGSTTISAASLVSAAAGWTSATSVAVLKAGFLTVNMNFTRTGADIPANANGTIGSVQMGTVNLAYRPHSALGTITVHAGNTNGAGTAQIVTATGAINVVKWSPNSNIVTGNVVSVSTTYALD